MFIENPIIVTVDIDDTLALWVSNSDGPPRYEPNHKLIEEIRKHNIRGHFVWGWSAGSAAWTKRVIEEFGLTEYFNIVSAKPAFMWDDRTPTEWTRICYTK